MPLPSFQQYTWWCMESENYVPTYMDYLHHLDDLAWGRAACPQPYDDVLYVDYVNPTLTPARESWNLTHFNPLGG